MLTAVPTPDPIAEFPPNPTSPGCGVRASPRCAPRWRPRVSPRSCVAGRTTSRTSRGPGAGGRPPRRRRGARSRCSRADEPRPSSSPQFPKARRPGPMIEEWLAVETAAGAQELVAVAPRGPIALDDMPVPAVDGARGRERSCDASVVLGPAKLTKTADELACIARRRRSTRTRCSGCGRSRCRASTATTVSGAFLARGRRAAARPRTRSTRCSR